MGYGEGGDYFYLFLFIFFARPGGVNIIVWVRGGLTGRGEGGKIMMIDFGKRRGENIILFAEKEFKPEGRGRGRGGALLLFIFLARPGGVNIIVWVRGGLTGRGEGGEDYDD